MIEHINISEELIREEVWELGRKVPYFRYIEFPVKITEELVPKFKLCDCKIEILMTEGCKCGGN